MASPKALVFFFFSAMAVQGTYGTFFQVPDFVSQTIAGGLSAAGGMIGVDVDEGQRAACETAGFYNTDKARKAAPAGGLLGVMTGAAGNAFSSKDWQKKFCIEHGYYNENLDANGNIIYVQDPPVDVYQPYDDQYQQYQQPYY